MDGCWPPDGLKMAPKRSLVSAYYRLGRRMQCQVHQKQYEVAPGPTRRWAAGTSICPSFRLSVSPSPSLLWKPTYISGSWVFFLQLNASPKTARRPHAQTLTFFHPRFSSPPSTRAAASTTLQYINATIWMKLALAGFPSYHRCRRSADVTPLHLPAQLPAPALAASPAD